MASAREAQPGWAAMPGVRRGEILHAVANLIEAHRQELAGIVALEAGKRMSDALGEASAAIQCARFFAGEGQRLFGRTMTSGAPHRWAMTVRRPCGVAGLITAANTPAPNFAWKVFPALICGNGVVLKPAEDTPASAWFMAKTAEEAGLPKGLLNLVHGLGAEVGPPLVVHPDVDVVSFTGSTRVGREIAESAGKLLKKVSLELGGKAASVVLDDADFEKAVRASVNHSVINCGQTCASWTRLLVPRARQAEAMAIAKDEAEKLTLGDPSLGQARLGPLVSAQQRERVRGYIRRGLEEGATLVTGGVEPPPGLERGFYVRPTVFADVTPRMAIAQEEIFGPVLAILPYQDEDEAVRIANDTIYGLGGAVWSRDPERARRVARRIRTSQIDVNGAPFNPLAPFGGVKQSGNGRELGRYGLEEYLEPKALQLEP